MDTKEKLDLLAEFYSQKDSIEFRKRELLNEIQVPAEIEQIVHDGMARSSAIDEKFRSTSKEFDAVFDKRISEIVVPQEYKDALAELDRQRAEIFAKMGEVEAQKKAIVSEREERRVALSYEASKCKEELQAEIDKQTRGVYDAINQKKQEIEIEFSGKADDVDANIKKLEDEIKADVKAEAAKKLEANPKSKDLSIKGQFFHAVYVKARKTWIPAKLDDYVETHPDIKNCYTEGEPSITLRRI